MRWYYLFALVTICHFVYAQEKELEVSENGVSTNAGKEDVIDPVKEKVTFIKDSILQKHTNNTFIDSLTRLEGIVKGQQVYSQQQWRVFKDSLKHLSPVNLAELEDISSSEITEDELIKVVNEEFFQKGSDSLINQFKEPWNTKNLSSIEDVPKKSGDLLSLYSAKELKLPESSLDGLSMLPANVVKSQYTKYLDSVRSVNLKGKKLKVREKQWGEGKLAEFKPKTNFWNRTYFEGVLGFTPGDFTIIQISPALAYHFTNYLSFGLGPNILMQKAEKTFVTTVGLKTLLKAEFFKKKLYLQFEDIMDSYGIKVNKEEKRTVFEDHNIFVGGGFLLSTKSAFTLNFSILYCLNENKVVTHQYSPLVFRIGLSSLKMNN